MSYTTFDYGKASASASSFSDNENLTVKISVKNSGKVSGKEVVQLYIGDETGKVMRPVKELKGFDKISLEPGEEREVSFTIKAQDLQYYDESISNWNVASGKFKAYIGSSSKDIRSTVSFTYKNNLTVNK